MKDWGRLRRERGADDGVNCTNTVCATTSNISHAFSIEEETHVSSNIVAEFAASLTAVEPYVLVKDQHAPQNFDATLRDWTLN